MSEITKERLARWVRDANESERQVMLDECNKSLQRLNTTSPTGPVFDGSQGARFRPFKGTDAKPLEGKGEKIPDNELIAWIHQVRLPTRDERRDKPTRNRLVYAIEMLGEFRATLKQSFKDE